LDAQEWAETHVRYQVRQEDDRAIFKGKNWLRFTLHEYWYLERVKRPLQSLQSLRLFAQTSPHKGLENTKMEKVLQQPLNPANPARGSGVENQRFTRTSLAKKRAYRATIKNIVLRKVGNRTTNPIFMACISH
jgi:hypothetical protein